VIGSKDAAALPAPAAAPGDGGLRRRALAVLAVRLGAIGVLLGGSLVLSPLHDSFTPSALLWLIATAFAATVAFAIALQRGAAPRVVAGAQVALDLGLATGLIYLTGGALSGFGSLYAAVILVAALLLGPRPTFLVGGLALALYLGLAMAIADGWVRPPSDQPFARYLVASDVLFAAVLRTSVGLLVVSALAGTLADRLSAARGEAVRATEAARGYQRFAEDVVRSIASGLVTVDLEGKIETANTTAIDLLRTSEDALVGRPVGEVLPVEPGTARVRVDGTGHRSDGTTFAVGLTRTPLRDESGRVHGALIVFQDLSELVMLREKAERTERLAAVGRLAVGLAHEIRNPLGSISSSVELVRDSGTLGEEDRRLLELVLEETARLDELVGTMLSVGRPTLPERSPVDLAALAREVVDVARSKSPAPIELSAPEAAVAAIDPGQVRRVIWNLTKNAIQFSPRGEPVRVRVLCGHDEVLLEVEDRGPGIAQADRERIFDMFFTKRTHGVGIGLALVKQIVDAHGARIDVDSTEGRGSLFRVRFRRDAEA
jgi:two-component system sensor histidine kinase PilS (NtrC family)